MLFRDGATTDKVLATRLCLGFAELGEDAHGALRVKEGNVHGVSALAGSLVDKADACSVSLSDSVGYAVLNAECHVVHALAALLEISSDGALGRCGLKELQLHLANLEEGGLHFLVFNYLGLVALEAEYVLEIGENFFNAFNGDADVFDLRNLHCLLVFRFVKFVCDAKLLLFSQKMIIFAVKIVLMQYLETEIKGVWVIEPKVFKDARGYFMETYRQEDFDANVGPTVFVQDNESRSSYGVVRGLHYQKGEWSQAKLVRVLQGKVLDVAVDLRRSSATFGKYVAVELSDENKRQLFIPRGFAHGFAVLSDIAVFAYKVDNKYMPSAEAGIRFDDPAIGIDWPIAKEDMLLSEKDRTAVSLKDAEVF